MKQKEVFRKIGEIIRELNDQYEYLKTVTDELNDLELELFVSNAHFLTDHIEILCKLNLQNAKARKPPVEKTETTHEQKYFEPVVQQMKHGAGVDEEKSAKETFKLADAAVERDIEPDGQPTPQIDLTETSPVDTYSFIREEPETIRHELILDESQNWDDDEIIPEEEEEEEGLKQGKKKKISPATVDENIIDGSEVIAPPPTDNEQAAAPVAATVEEVEVLTVNQKMSVQKGDKGRAEQLSIKPISDIKLAITLNDKLLYVKDLFNGYNLAYSEAIEILNRFNTFEEASRFLNTNYVTKNSWDSKPATTEKFYALLKRRYA